MRELTQPVKKFITMKIPEIIPQNEVYEFHNFSNEDFTWNWDGTPYTFKAGQKIMLEAYKAFHFAKHLVNRELQKLSYKDKEGVTHFRQVNDPMRVELMAKALRQIGKSQTEDVAKDAKTITLNEKPKEEKKPEKKELPLHLRSKVDLELIAENAGFSQEEIEKAGTRKGLIEMIKSKEQKGEKEAEFEGA